MPTERLCEADADECTPLEYGAPELGITDRAVEGRMGTMLENLRKRVGKLGPVPEMDCLRLVVSRPGAIETLRRAG